MRDGDSTMCHFPGDLPGGNLAGAATDHDDVTGQLGARRETGALTQPISSHASGDSRLEFTGEHVKSYREQSQRHVVCIILLSGYILLPPSPPPRFVI